MTLFADDSTELAVTDAGLRGDRSMTRWDALAGYRVTDDETTLERARRSLPSRGFDRNDVDDAAFIQALSEFLPETGDETERATTTTNLQPSVITVARLSRRRCCRTDRECCCSINSKYGVHP